MNLAPRLIPCLLLKSKGFVKTTKFNNPRYLGDPLNILKIFNEKEVDELIILDITATRMGHKPQFEFLAEMASECFMPLTYGGGLTSLEAVEKILATGFEKVCINTALEENPNLVKEAAYVFGSQSIVASIDVRRNFWGSYETMIRGGTKKTGKNPIDVAKQAQDLGAGELVVNSIDRDGTMQGYDLELIKSIARAVSIPVVASGGAGSLNDLARGVNVGQASAVAAGSLFVFQGTHRAVLVNVPNHKTWTEALDNFHLS